ncbi:MAG: methyltransferase [Marinitoga sp. 4572_148]|nr:MAG: methyltransferase [Marinitoga sp. 4572_148]
MEKLIITTSHKPSKEQLQRVKQLAEDYGLIYKNRRHLKTNNIYFVVEKNLTVKVKKDDFEFFFHPSIVKIRMKNFVSDKKDYLLNNMELKGDETILDLTFGLGSEALLIASQLKEGKLIGLEGSFPIYFVVKESIQYYPYKIKWLKEASKRIEIINDNYKRFIRKQKDKSYDIIYCDPMFENPVFESSALNPLRRFAVYDELEPSDIDEMKRVARNKVIIKAHIKDSIWDKYKFDKIDGSKNSGVFYGVIYLK